MELAVIGSSAWENGRAPADFDIICSPEDFKEYIRIINSKDRYSLQWLRPTDAGMAAGFSYRYPGDFNNDQFIIDAEFTGRENPSSQLVYDYILETGEHEYGVDSSVDLFIANLDTLYMLKMSHRYKKNSPHFKKTMDDIIEFRKMGAKIPDQGLYQARMDATYGYSHPNLKRTKEEFFVTSGELKYEYDHDSLHEAVAHLDRPMYTYYAVDGEQVLSSRSKFEALPELQKIWGVLEESYVLALERSVIPFGTDPTEAFMMALEKVCTSITSGWFREYAWENYYECIEVFRDDDSYVQKFNEAAKSGVAKRIDAD